MRSICASTCGSPDLNFQRRSELENEGLRQGLQQMHGRLKRNKALRGVGEWNIAVLDGHEHHASYRRHCRGCLKRTLRTEQDRRRQAICRLWPHGRRKTMRPKWQRKNISLYSAPICSFTLR